MKRIILLCFIAVSIRGLSQENASPYQFKVIKSLESTDAKDQCKTGTCWSFATTSFLESELIRTGKGSHDLSEMFNVRVTYPKKAWFYIRAMGKTQFGPGSLGHDVINTLKSDGLVPESAYPGLQGGSGKHNHEELDALLEAMVKSLAERQGLSEQWDDAMEAVLDSYLGDYPVEFDYQGKRYTPISFRDAMGLKAEDYVNLSSFSHVPFYENFILEVPDNFSRGSFVNLPLDELVLTVKNAIEKGYSVNWDADVSEKGFSFKDGVAIYPSADLPKSELFKQILEEPKVDQAMRQKGYDSHATTDDHLMHITGLANDQNGKLYFIIKNSWGVGNEMQGFQYVSEAYFRMKTIAVTIHKDGVTPDIMKKIAKK